MLLKCITCKCNLCQTLTDLGASQSGDTTETRRLGGREAEEGKTLTEIKEMQRGGRKKEGGGRGDKAKGEPVGPQQGCDHASWISISKQNKYSSSLPALLTSHSKSLAVHSRLMISICRLLHVLAVQLSRSLISSAPHSSFLPSKQFFFNAPFLLAHHQLTHVFQHRVGFIPPDDVHDYLDGDTTKLWNKACEFITHLSLKWWHWSCYSFALVVVQ